MKVRLFFIKTHSIKVDVLQDRKIYCLQAQCVLMCVRVRASFSPKMLQAEAVKGLKGDGVLIRIAHAACTIDLSGSETREALARPSSLLFVESRADFQ